MKSLLGILVFVLANLAVASELTVVRVSGQTPVGKVKTFTASDTTSNAAEKRALEKCHDSGAVECEISENLKLADNEE